jgi:glycosyltransferase involved in cell wall biosynthesis
MERNMLISVVIANRNDPLLSWTIENVIQKSVTNPQIIIVHDGKQDRLPMKSGGALHFGPFAETRGPMACRDYGIQQARGELIFITDAHMDFEQGWDAKLIDAMKDHPKRAACCICHHNAEIDIDDTEHVYYGAHCNWISEDKGQKWVLNGQWRNDSSTGPIGCVMGASYAFSRSWYMDGIGRPWQGGRGWGMDEESLSIATWLMGGDVVLLPIHVAHQYRTQAQVGYELGPREQASVWFQRWLIVNMLPISEEQRKELLDALMVNGAYRAHYKAFEAWGGDEAVRLRNLYATGPMTMDQYRSEWIDGKGRAPKISRADLVRRAKLAGVKYWSRMSKAQLEDALAKIYKPKQLEAPPMPKKATKKKTTNTKRQTAARANYGAEESNRLCQVCGSASSRVNNTKTTGIVCLRYRQCECGARRVTREIIRNGA